MNPNVLISDTNYVSNQINKQKKNLKNIIY